MNAIHSMQQAKHAPHKRNATNSLVAYFMPNNICSIKYYSYTLIFIYNTIQRNSSTHSQSVGHERVGVPRLGRLALDDDGGGGYGGRDGGDKGADQRDCKRGCRRTGGLASAVGLGVEASIADTILGTISSWVLAVITTKLSTNCSAYVILVQLKAEAEL